MKEVSESGFIIRLTQDRYMMDVKAKEQKYKPKVWLTLDLEHAKIWYQPSAVRKARSRAGLGGEILLVRRDENGRRVIVGRLGKEEAEDGNG